MSRLFVLEPNIMLRYGLAMALTPDHAIRFIDSLPASPVLRDVDAVIADTAMLRQAKHLTPSRFEAVAGGQVPTVWIDDMELTSPPAHGSFVILNAPVRREQLHRALFDCLSPSAGSTPPARKIEPRAATPAKARGTKPEGSASAPPDADNVIDLVEVVEDEQGTG